MSEIRPLLVRPPILPEETLPSYLYRLAGANLLSQHQFKALLNSCLKENDNVNGLLRGDTCNVLAQLTNLESYKIFWASKHSIATLVEDLDDTYDTVTLDSGFSFPLLTEKAANLHIRKAGRSQFCPECLREAAYQRRAWRARKIAACIHHECLLVDQCPRCDGYFSDYDIITATCSNCQYHLEDATALDLSDDQDGLDTQRLLYFWLNAGPYNHLPLPPIPNRILYLLASQMMDTTLKVRREISGLHPFPSLNTPYNWKSWKRHAPSSKHTYVLWATAIRAFFNWPFNFHQFLEHRALADYMSYSSNMLIRMSWRQTRWLKQWPPEKNQLVHQALADFLYHNSCWGYAQNDSGKRDAVFVKEITPSFPAFTSSFEWVRESMVVRLLNVRTNLIKSLVQAGLIRCLAKTAKLKDPLVSREDVLAFHKKWQQGIPLSDVMPALHISRELACHLVNAGLLKPAENMAEADGAIGGLDKASVNSLIDDLYWLATARKFTSASFYSLNQTCRILGQSHCDKLELFQLALEKKIPALLRKGETLGDIMFRKRSIRLLAKYNANQDAFISIDDFCDQFQIAKTSNYISELVGERLVSWPLLDRYLLKSEVDELRRKFYSFIEAKALLKVKKRVVDDWIKSGDLPIAVESNGYYMALFFLKEDVEKLLPENSYSQRDMFELLETA